MATSPSTSGEDQSQAACPSASATSAGSGVRGWLFTGGLSVVVAVAVVSIGRTLHAGMTISIAAAVVSGWAAVIVFAPWPWLARARAREADLKRLAAALARLDLDDRDAPLSRLLIDRRDEVGEVSRLVHDLLAQALGDRKMATAMVRSIDDTVARKTRIVTGKLQREATTDPLTGVGNRRALDATFNDLYRGRETPSVLVSVVTIDMDHFKEVNDRLGHAVGDQCLIFLAEILSTTVRQDDVVIRQGGDEFLIVMPGVGSEAARQVAERFRSLFAQMAWPHRDVSKPTLSIGLAMATPRQPCSPETLIRSADDAMYRVKQAGRDSIAVHPGGRSAA